MGILWLFSPNYARAGALVIVQGFGCFLLGIFRAKKASLTSWRGNEDNPSIFTGLSTGLCGSITTFSGWMLQSYLLGSTAGSVYRGIEAAILYLILTSLVCTASLTIGGFIAGKSEDFKPWRFTPRSLHILAIVLLLALCSAMIVLTVLVKITQRWMIPCFLGVIGALLRWRLAVRFNSSTPWGTIAANMSGTLCLALFYVWGNEGGYLSQLSCQAVYAFTDGFCGCLTTVSTFFSELSTMKRGKALRYFLGSVSVGVAIMGIVLGVHQAAVVRTRQVVPVC